MSKSLDQQKAESVESDGMTQGDQAAALGQAIIDHQTSTRELAALNLTLARSGRELVALGRALEAQHIARTILFTTSTILIEAPKALGEPAQTLSRDSFDLEAIARLIHDRAVVQDRIDAQRQLLRGVNIDVGG